MTIQMDLWRVSGSNLERLPPGELDLEDRLEAWLAEDPTISGMSLAIIGRQVQTAFAGRIDLLGIDSQGNTVVLELKRGRTPRDVVAQVLDYASWVQDLSFGDLDRICREHHDKELASLFSSTFDSSLPETVNDDHLLLIVASEFDASSERIVNYLAEERDIPINAVFFDVFRLGEDELLGRAWLRDPSEMEDQVGSHRRVPWRGYWFVNVGEGESRNWDDNRKYGFLSAGRGEWYSTSLKRLAEGSEVFAYMRERGYVGYGLVASEAELISEFKVDDKGTRLVDLPLKAPEARHDLEDSKLAEWVVGVDWKKTFDREEAKWFTGAFANQNIVCKLRHPATVQYLERIFDTERKTIGTP